MQILRKIIIIYFILIVMLITSCSNYTYEPMYLKLKINKVFDSDTLHYVLMKKERVIKNDSTYVYNGIRSFTVHNPNSTNGYFGFHNYMRDWYANSDIVFKCKPDTFYVLKIEPPFKNCDDCLNKDSILFYIRPSNRNGIEYFSIKYLPCDTVGKDFIYEEFKLQK